MQPCVQPTDATETEISWVDIETEYVTDMRKKPCTLKGLAEKYGVSLQRVKEYAAECEWTAKRNKHHTNTIQKTVEKWTRWAEKLAHKPAPIISHEWLRSNGYAIIGMLHCSTTVKMA